jgi:hypothetical protein
VGQPIKKMVDFVLALVRIAEVHEQAKSKEKCLNRQRNISKSTAILVGLATKAHIIKTQKTHGEMSDLW